MGAVLLHQVLAGRTIAEKVVGELSEVEGKEPGTFTVEVSTYGTQALFWEGYAENVSDALHKALDQREEELGSEEA